MTYHARLSCALESHLEYDTDLAIACASCGVDMSDAKALLESVPLSDIPDQPNNNYSKIPVWLQPETNVAVDASKSELLRFSSQGADLSLMKSEDPYIQEMACLHGLSDNPRHSNKLNTSYDRDEMLAMVAVPQSRRSQSQ